MQKIVPVIARFKFHPFWLIAAMLLTAGTLFLAEKSPAQTNPATSGLPSETPTQLQPVTDSFDYTRRDVMIPMRDGVKLHTVIIVPMGAGSSPALV